MAKISDTRERLRAVGCGAGLLLVAAFIFLGGGGSAFWSGEPIYLLILPLSLAPVVAAFLAFRDALSARGDDDDLLDGPRATALVATIIAVIAIIAIVLTATLSVDFWRGLTTAADRPAVRH